MVGTSRFTGFTKELALVSLASSLGSIVFGYDNTWWSGVLGEVAFGQAFGSVRTLQEDGSIVRTLSSTQQSLGSGMSTAGIMLGCMLTPLLAKKYGRKICFMGIAILSLIGVILEVSASSGMTGRFAQMVVGRVVAALAMGMASCIVPVYQAECAPAQIRGALTSLYVIAQNLASTLCTLVMWRVNERSDPSAWLIPIGIQFVMPVLLVAVYWFIPESPRWLLMQGRNEEALKVVQYLRGPNYDASVEVEELAAAVTESMQQENQTSFFDCFLGTNLRRSLIAIGVQCFSNAQGIGYVVSYMIVLLIQLQINDVYLILFVAYLVYWIFACTSFFLPDIIGRRPLMFIGSALCAMAMFTIAGITTVEATPTGAKSKTVVGMTLIWFMINAATWSPISWLTPAEVASAALRDRTMALASWSGFGVNLIINFVAPFLQNPGYGNLSGRIGYIWGSFSVAAAVWAFFLVPELKGKSLEEIDVLFTNKVGTLAFAKTDISKFDTILAGQSSESASENKEKSEAESA